MESAPPPPSAPRSAVTVALPAAIAGILALLATYPIHNPDVWWHLKTGELIWQEQAVPRTNRYAAVAPETTWIDASWGSQLLGYGLWSAGGPSFLLLGKLAVLLAAFGLVWGEVRRALPPERAAPLVLLAVVAVFGRTHVRPYLFSLLLFAFLVSRLLRWRRAPDRSTPWWLLGLFLVWANLHPGFIAGLAAAGLLILGQGIARRLPLRHALGLGAGLLGATLVNPYGWRLYATYLRHSPAVTGPVEEWGGLLTGRWSAIQVAYLLLAGWLVWSFRGRRWRRWDLSLLAAGLILMPLLTRRTMAEFALGAPLLIAANTAARPPGGAPSRPLAPALALLGVVSAGLLLHFGRYPGFPLLPPHPPGWGLAPTTPTALADRLNQIPPDGVLFNTYEDGGYLIWACYPRWRVFIDPRPQVYGPDHFRDYLTAVRAEPGWERVLDRHAVTWALLPLHTPLAGVLADTPGWEVRLQGEGRVLYHRTSLPKPSPPGDGD